MSIKSDLSPFPRGVIQFIVFGLQRHWTLLNGTMVGLLLLIGVMLTGRIHADGNEGITVPHKVDPKPSWVFTGSSQSPSPAVRGTPVTITWNFTATNGKHRSPYLLGDPPPNPTSHENWGVEGKGPLDGESVSFSMTSEAIARNSAVNFWGLNRAWYWDPCGGPPNYGESPLFPSHEFSLRPADPNDPTVDPHNLDGPFDPDDPTVKDPEDPEDPDEPFVPQEKPDQGEVDLLHEFLDISSFQFVPYRGYVPKRSDSYLAIKKTDKTNLNMTGVNDLSLELTHRIVTINSPDARDLKGVLKLEVSAGNPQDYEVFHYNSATHQSQRITFPFQMNVVEPGHVGGGVHDFHAGYEGFTFRRVGDGPLELKVTVDPDEGDPFKMAVLHLLPVEFNVDANNDGIITIGESASMAKPYDIWPNDDDDMTSGEPQRPDYTTPSVDGAKDLEDFFPVFLDIQQLVKALPPSATVKYKLKQADGAVNFTATNLTREAAFAYRDGTLRTGFGPSLSHPASYAATMQITGSGVELSTQFLNNIKDYNKGVILVEGRTPSTAPLVLTVEENGVQRAEISLPLRIEGRILLLLHGMNSNTKTWDSFVNHAFGYSIYDSADIRNGVIEGTAPSLTATGVRCYRLQFGAFEWPGTARTGLESLTAAIAKGGISGELKSYLDQPTLKCGDFETFTELAQEVDDAIALLLVRHPNAKIVMMGHSRGGMIGRMFLQGSSPRRSAVSAFLVTSSPQKGSPIGRIYEWLDRAANRRPPGSTNDDWQAVDFLRNPKAPVLGTYVNKDTVDVRRPVIDDMSDLSPAIVSLTIPSLNDPARVANLPAKIMYGEIIYCKVDLGVMTLVPGGFADYKIFDDNTWDGWDQVSTAAETALLGAGKSPSDFPGDGLVPFNHQVFTTLPGFPAPGFPPAPAPATGQNTIPRLQVTSEDVVHTEAPSRFPDIISRLRLIAPKWFP